MRRKKDGVRAVVFMIVIFGVIGLIEAQTPGAPA